MASILEGSPLVHVYDPPCGDPYPATVATVRSALPNCAFGLYLFSITYDLACYNFYGKYSNLDGCYKTLVSLDGKSALEHDDLRLPSVVRDRALGRLRRVLREVR